MRVNHAFYFNAVFLFLILIQLSVVTEAISSSAVRLLHLILCFLPVLFFTFLSLVASKRNLYFQRQIVTTLIFFVTLEVLILIGQPALMDFRSIIQRFVVYVLIISGSVYGFVSSYKSFSSIDNRFLVILCLICVYFFLGYQDIVTQVAMSQKGRITASDDISEVGIAFSFSIMATTFLALSFCTKKAVLQCCYLLVGLLMVIPVFYSASRGAVLALMVVLFVLIFQFFRSMETTRLKKILFFTLLLLGFLYFSYSVFSDPILLRQFEYLYFRFTGLGDVASDVSSAGRFDIISYYFESIDFTIFFGFFGYSGWYPHNLALDLSIRFGLIGLLLSGFVYWSSLVILFFKRGFAVTNVEVALFSIFLFSFINSQYSLTSEFLRIYWFTLFYFYTKIRYSSVNII